MGRDRSGRGVEAGGLKPGLKPSGDEPRFYGRRQGRPLRKRRAALLEDALDRYAIDFGDDGPLDPLSLFGAAPSGIWLEVGFGSGEHLVWQAARNPDIGFIGAEPFFNGVASCLGEIQEQGFTNVRLHADDVRPLLDRLPEASIDKVFVLQPDPWRKRRHWGRRLIGPDGLNRIARVLKDGGELRTSTDHPGYQKWMLRFLREDRRFSWLAKKAADWRQRPDDWPQTRYEAKAISAGRPVAYLRFERCVRGA